VDTPEDLDALQETIDAGRLGAQRTRGALRQLNRSGARPRLSGASPPDGPARPEPAGRPSS
jgi:hypothetical protein